MSIIGLHNLKAAPGSNKAKRRRGRGSASGKGNYSGRGMKGQRARSGGKGGLVLRGVKGYLAHIPKLNGFRSLQLRKNIVNLGDLEANFAAGDVISPISLFKKDLIKTLKGGIKVLGAGKLTKAFTVKAHFFSKSAEAAIIKAGGKIETIAKAIEEEVKK